MGRVVTRKVGADHLPTRPAVPGHVHHLTADVELGVIVGRDGDRERPVPTVLEVRRAPAVARLRPDAYVARLIGASVVNLEPAVIAARPDGRVVHRIRDGKAALAATDVPPLPLAEPTRQAAARHAVGRAVLP